MHKCILTYALFIFSLFKDPSMSTTFHPFTFPSINQLMFSNFRLSTAKEAVKKQSVKKTPMGCVIFTNATRKLFYITRCSDPSYKGLKRSFDTQNYYRFSTSMCFILTNTDASEWSHRFVECTTHEARATIGADWVEVWNGAVYKSPTHLSARTERLKALFPEFKNMPAVRKKKVYCVSHPDLTLTQYVVVSEGSTFLRTVMPYLRGIESALDKAGYVNGMVTPYSLEILTLAAFIKKFQALNENDPVSFMEDFNVTPAVHYSRNIHRLHAQDAVVASNVKILKNWITQCHATHHNYFF
jgi:hypothetical protein